MNKKRLRVAERCEVPYEAMTPRGAGRHCADCDRVVVNLSALTERQALSLFRASGGDLCGYVHHDGRGEPMFKPEPRAGVAIGAMLAGALAACEPSGEPAVSLTPIAADSPLADGAGEDAFVMMPMSEPPTSSVSSTTSPPAPAPPTLAHGADVPDPTASEEVGAASCETEEPTAEDRALERRKRRRRLIVQPQRPVHDAYAGMMMLSE
ncbi:MAG: hypothetical protein J0L92_35085 [Deltaproteobacteria bacterium]|nr:hypothetical protein [Deltaproteobacteria bacterium]